MAILKSELCSEPSLIASIGTSTLLLRLFLIPLVDLLPKNIIPDFLRLLLLDEPLDRTLALLEPGLVTAGVLVGLFELLMTELDALSVLLLYSD